MFLSPGWGRGGGGVFSDLLKRQRAWAFARAVTVHDCTYYIICVKLVV